MKAGEQVQIGDEDPVAPPGPGRAGPAGQGTAALGDPAGHLVEGAAIGQCPAEAGGGSEGGGETPHQVLPLPDAEGGPQGKDYAGQQQDGTEHPVDALGAVVHLDLAAKAGGGAGPLGVGVLPVPLALVQSDQIGLCGSRCGAAGQAQGTPLVIGAVEQEEQAEQGGGTVGELPAPVLAPSQQQGIRQGEGAGEGGQGVHPHLQPQTAPQAGGQHVERQQHTCPQKPGGDPEEEGISHRQLRGEGARERGEQAGDQSGGGQKKDQ